MVRCILGLGALAGGLALLVLNVAGLILPIPEHPRAQHTKHKKDLVRPSYEDTLQALSRIDRNLPNEHRLALVNRIIAARVVNYWPKPDEVDVNTMHSFLEGWYMALLQRGEAWLAAKGVVKVDLARVGRRDFREILAKGVGICGMSALAVVDYLGEQGQSAKMLALGRHVVAFASANGRNYIMDPTFAVFIPDVPAPPDKSMSKIISAYSEAGYSGRKLASLEKLYSQSSMKLLEVDRFQGRWKRTLVTARVIKWVVPALLIALGIVLLLKLMSRQSCD
jgi:hypothetical protein